MTNKIGNLVTLKNKYRYTSLFDQNGSEINIIISNEPLLILSQPIHHIGKHIKILHPDGMIGYTKSHFLNENYQQFILMSQCSIHWQFNHT